MRTVNILWTGGLDSSYRVAELSKMECIIQPYYILAAERLSYKYELSAIRSITSIIRKHPDTKAVLNDVIVVDEKTLAPSEDIHEARLHLTERCQLGSQYEFIARFAQQYALEVEVGVLFTERGKVSKCLGGGSDDLLLEENGDYAVYKVNQAVVNKDACMIFGRLLFPKTLRNITKLDEAEGFKKLGLEAAYKKTWFCHKPILGMPCGKCNPCLDCLAEGMPERVPYMGRFFGLVRAGWKKITR